MDSGAGGGSDNASSGGAGGTSACCYYALLGIRKNSSATDIRAAYRRLALKWHLDRWASDPGAAGEAKRRFQRIQEAYSGMCSLGDFVQKPDTMEDLQKMLEDIVSGGDGGSCGGSDDGIPF